MRVTEERNALLDGRESVGELISLLGHPSLRERRAAIAALAGKDPSETLPALLAAIGDDANAAARNAASDVLLRYGARIVPALARALDAGSHRDRTIHLLGVMARLPGRDTVDAVIPLAEHTDPSVAAAAIGCLGALKDPAVVPTLLSVLDRGERWQTFYAIDALGEVGHAAAVTRLVPLAGDAYYRKAVLRSLGRIGDESAVRPLVEALGGQPRPDRTALAALAEMVERARTVAGRESLVSRINSELARACDVGLIEGLSRLMEEGDADTRRHAAVALGWAADARAVPALVRALVDPVLAEAAASALDRLAAAGAAALVIASTADTVLPPEGLCRIVRAVSASTDERVDRFLLDVMRHEDEDVRQAALATLADRVRPEHLEVMLGRLEDPCGAVCAEAIRGLLALATRQPAMREEIAGRVDGFTASPQPSVRRAALRVIARLRTEGSADILDLALRDAAPIVRREAVALLAEDGNRDRLWRLTAALADEDPRVREEVVQAIGRLGDGQSRGILLSALQDASLWVRTRAARALGDHPAVEVRAALEETARAEHLPVRVAAIESLGRLLPATRETLLSLAGDPEPEARRAVLRALASVSPSASLELLACGLEDPVWMVRCAAAETLGRTREAAAFGPLARALDREADPGVRRALLVGLTEVDAESALPFLVPALAEKDVAEKAAELLVAGHRLYADALRAEWAAGVDPATREGLAVVLQEIGRRESARGEESSGSEA